MQQTTQTLDITLDGQVLLSINRTSPISDMQNRYLNNMEQRMNDGIELNGSMLTQPHVNTKAQFVANRMIRSLINHENNLSTAMATYLKSRLPRLHQVKCEKSGDLGLSVMFIFDTSNNQTSVETPPVKHILDLLN